MTRCCTSMYLCTSRRREPKNKGHAPGRGTFTSCGGSVPNFDVVPMYEHPNTLTRRTTETIGMIVVRVGQVRIGVAVFASASSPHDRARGLKVMLLASLRVIPDASLNLGHRTRLFVCHLCECWWRRDETNTCPHDLPPPATRTRALALAAAHA